MEIRAAALGYIGEAAAAACLYRNFVIPQVELKGQQVKGFIYTFISRWSYYSVWKVVNKGAILFGTFPNGMAQEVTLNQNAGLAIVQYFFRGA